MREIITTALVSTSIASSAMAAETLNDIAIRYQRPAAPGLVARALATIEYGVYACPGYTTGKRAEDYAFLGFDADLAQAPHAVWLDDHAGNRPFAMRSNDLDCQVRRKLWLVMHEDVRRSPRVRATADAVIRLFAS